MILLHKQIELARAKAVIKISELADEYEEKTGDLFYRGYDKAENGISIVSDFETRQSYENFCKNIDILLKQIDSLTSTSDNIIKKEKILDVITNCRNLHINSYMKNFYYDGTLYQFEIKTPSSADCPIFTDAALTMMNEWECQLEGKNHQIISTEGYLFNLEEFFRHLIPDKNPRDFHLDNDVPKTVNSNKDEDNSTYDYLLSPYSRICSRIWETILRIDRRNLKRLALLFIGIFCLILGFIMLKESQDHGLSLIDKQIWTSVPVKNLDYEIYKLRQQVYTLQQASAKHDNYLQELGMDD